MKRIFEMKIGSFTAVKSKWQHEIIKKMGKQLKLFIQTLLEKRIAKFYYL
jgi:hypothetical protein